MRVCHSELFNRPFPRRSRMRPSTFSLRSGKCSSSQRSKSGATAHGKRTIVYPANCAPACAHASRIFGASWSVSPGIIGATITPTGIPAARSCLTASKRASGEDVRGSSTRCNFGSSDVMEMFTAAASNFASSCKRSTSRVTRRFFVMIATGLRNLASTSRQPRVIRSCFSTG